MRLCMRTGKCEDEQGKETVLRSRGEGFPANYRNKSSMVMYATDLLMLARGFKCHRVGGGFVSSREVGVGAAGGVGGGRLAISAKLGFGVVTGVEKEVRGVTDSTDVRPGVGTIAGAAEETSGFVW